ncbi:MobQ family relaxase [Brevibacillus nitrificans]|uniref:MobQ family relaxase n=1 Tax=Brevibacillus nitrificans TaxID=651560 RepID=UPI0009BABA62|nr:MobQ family relaxase [Brevibacillus nitrificans]MDR7319648.1 ATP-dependent exoDNAse (exonuclease V) alpha subunit [Brevibacillus nitrificans]
MAIYHFSAQVISRSQGRSVVAAAAYRAGERLEDERYGQTHDYTKKSVSERAIAAPANAPAWAKDREQLWNAVEAAEKRKDAQLCREINVALPRELSAAQQRELLSTFVSKEFVSRGMVADVAIHRDNPENPHAHIMLTMREITSEGFGKKVREWNDKELLETWRAEWANYANRGLERAGYSERIDHRSLEAQGSDRLPTVHEGPHVRQMESRGIQTDRGDLNRAVAEYNGLVVSLEAYRKEKHALVKERAEKAPVEPVESQEKQIAVLIEKGKEIKGKVERIDVDLQKVQERLQYYSEQQQRIADRNRLEKQIGELQQSGRGLLGLYNKNSKEIMELQRKAERLDERIQEHRSFAPSDREAVELQAKHKQLEQTKKELSGQFFAVRNKVKQLEMGQEKMADRPGNMTLRQAIYSLKDKVVGIPMRYVEADLDKQLEKAKFSNRGGVEELHYRLQDGTERSVLFQNGFNGAQRSAMLDIFSAAASAASKQLQHDDRARQQQMKKKRREMER